jgi:formylglycine-generating enzyme required for sulfatase activity
LHTRVPWRIILVTAVIAFLAGCGGGSENRTTPDGAALRPAAAPAAENAPPQPAVEPQRASKPKSAKTDRERPALARSVNPHDVFAIIPGQQSFELVKTDGQPISADTFTVIAPPKGIDSTHFEPAVPTVNPPARSPGRKAAAAVKSDRKTGDRKTGDRKTGDRKTADHKSTNRKQSDHELADRKPAESKPAESKTGDEESTAGGKTLPAGFTAIAAAQESRLGWPARIRCDRNGAEMALVTGGAVVVGHDGGPPESSPQISVVLDSFYMDVTEVTVGQYERFRKALKEEKGRNIIAEPQNAASPPDFPALGVTLTQAQFYARWAGQEIPTEAEWERAARGEAAFDHPWGNGRAIWKRARGFDQIDPVKSFRTDVSPFGIYDLAGNAREWCVDHYSPTAFADALKASNGQLRNWKGPRTGQQENSHVVKGNGPHWDAWYRAGMNGLGRHPDVGFRCILRLPEKSE